MPQTYASVETDWNRREEGNRLVGFLNVDKEYEPASPPVVDDIVISWCEDSDYWPEAMLATVYSVELVEPRVNWKKTPDMYDRKAFVYYEKSYKIVMNWLPEHYVNEPFGRPFVQQEPTLITTPIGFVGTFGDREYDVGEADEEYGTH